MASNDLCLHVGNKLSGEWSSPAICGMLSKPVIQHLIARWDSLDALVQARLVLSPLFLPPSALEALREPVERLLAKAREDSESWAGIIAWLVSGRGVRGSGRESMATPTFASEPFETAHSDEKAAGSQGDSAAPGQRLGSSASCVAPLSIHAAAAQSPLVQTSLASLLRAAGACDPDLYRPLEETLLSTSGEASPVLPPEGENDPAAPALSPRPPPHQYFRLRSLPEGWPWRMQGLAEPGEAPESATLASGSGPVPGGAEQRFSEAADGLGRGAGAPQAEAVEARPAPPPQTQARALFLPTPGRSTPTGPLPPSGAPLGSAARAKTAALDLGQVALIHRASLEARERERAAESSQKEREAKERLTAEREAREMERRVERARLERLKKEREAEREAEREERERERVGREEERRRDKERKKAERAEEREREKAAKEEERVQERERKKAERAEEREAKRAEVEAERHKIREARKQERKATRAEVGGLKRKRAREDEEVDEGCGAASDGGEEEREAKDCLPLEDGPNAKNDQASCPTGTDYAPGAIFQDVALESPAAGLEPPEEPEETEANERCTKKSA